MKKCPRGMKVQSLLFPITDWALDQVEAWVRYHKYKMVKFHITDNYIRVGQHNPNKFEPESFRLISFGNRIKAVVGCPLKL